jgi:hypothetical protein
MRWHPGFSRYPGRMKKIRIRKRLLALAIFVPVACHAQQPGPIRYGKVSVPFDGLREQRDPVAPYRELTEQLKRRAAAEARDGRLEPVVSLNPAGPRGERYLISAVTPTKGVFYISEVGPYPMGPGPAVIVRRGQIDACRIEISWDRLPGGAYAPGTEWAAVKAGFPDISCKPFAGAPPSKAAEWRQRSESALYTIAGRAAGAGLKVALVREHWAGRLEHLDQPFDGGRAVAALAGPDTRILRATALFDDDAFYVETAGGRTFMGIPHRPGRDMSCIVEGLRWQEIASAQRPRWYAARNLCAEAVSQYARSLEPKPGEPGPTFTPVPPPKP